MKIDWLYFAPALVLLLPPIPLRGATKTFSLSRRHATTASISSMLSLWQNWVDVLRAGLGTFLLAHRAILNEAGIANPDTRGLLLIAMVAGLGLLFQTVRFSRGVQLVAPIFYLSGMTLVFSDFATGGFAVFAGWMFAVGAGKISYQIPVTIIALGGAGCLILGPSIVVILGCLLTGLPLFAAFLLRQPLLFVTKDPKPAAGAPLHPRPKSA